VKKKKIEVQEIDELLHSACRELNANGIIKAVQAGADVNAPDADGYAPLDIVSEAFDGWANYRHDPVLQKKVQRVVDVLIGYGADPDGLTGEFRPLETFAWSCGDKHICSSLAKAGATLNAVSEGETILDMVVGESIYLDVELRDGNQEVCPADVERMEIVSETLVRLGAKTFDELKKQSDGNQTLNYSKLVFEKREWPDIFGKTLTIDFDICEVEWEDIEGAYFSRLSSEEAFRFKEKLVPCHLEKWTEMYQLAAGVAVLDGCRWSLKLYDGGKLVKESSGQNGYPPPRQWKMFSAAVNFGFHIILYSGKKRKQKTGGQRPTFA
jgi:hypothetical protein